MTNHLFEAVINNDLDRVRLLIESCVATNANILEKKDSDGWTVLHTASFWGHLEIVKFLIESEFNVVLEKDSYGRTPLHWASANGHFEIVKFLIESMSNISNVCEFGSNISEKNNYGLTALHYASYHGYFDIVKYLVKVYIDTGLDIDIRNNEAKTVIDVAKTEEIKEFLIEQSEIQKNSYVLK